jgi:hypothetical protein
MTSSNRKKFALKKENCRLRPPLFGFYSSTLLCFTYGTPRSFEQAGAGIAALLFSVESAGAYWIHNKRIREHAYDYDQRWHADLLQGLGQRSAHRIQPRLAVVGR